MLAELVVIHRLTAIASANNFALTPDRRDQIPTNLTAQVTTQHVSSDGNSSLSGDAGPDHERIQITVFSRNKSDGIRIMKAIRQNLGGFRGELTLASFGKVFVSDCLHAGTRQIYDPVADGSQDGDYTLSIDFILSTSI